MIFKNRQKQVTDGIRRYLDKARECVSGFDRSFKAYCESGDLEELRKAVKTVHAAESEADDIRREIEDMMYSHALFPESRGDILGLLETLDHVPNQSESVIRDVLNQYISVPQDLRPRLFDLVDVSMRAVDAVFEATDRVFTRYQEAAEMIGKIDQLESEADGVEAQCLQRIFSSDLRGMDKILLRDLVRAVGAIADRSEDVGDRIRIMVAKRMV